jgi:2-polyprenyl-3-methyl-5-hydroxy-6-metoxy-1,4-benzoquinol methylase
MRSQSKKLQYGFSDKFKDTAFDGERRKEKAKKSLAVLQHYLGRLNHLSLVDLGCSTGFISEEYALYFKTVAAVDIDEAAVHFGALKNKRPNLHYFVMDSQQTAFKSQSFDVVTCTHIYEHVPDSHKLVKEIHRLLRPGGVCYFAAGNRLTLIEPHYRLPFLSIIPKGTAHLYLQKMGKGSYYYENHLSYWGLKKLVSDFEICDYTFEVVKSPQDFHAADVVRPGSFKQRLSLYLLKFAYWTCPTYLWLLIKKK